MWRLSTWFSCCIPTSLKLSILADVSELDRETKTSHIVLTALCIAKKIILITANEKKNSLCITQCRILLLDHISLEKTSVSSKKQKNKKTNYWMNLFLIGLHWSVPLLSWGWSAIVTFPCVPCRWLGVNSRSKEVWQFSGVLKVAAAVLWHTYVCFGRWWWVAVRSAAL